MTTLLYHKIHLLPPDKLQELMIFVDFLLYKEAGHTPAPPKRRKFGCAKGKIKMSEDFDAPLEI